MIKDDTCLGLPLLDISGIGLIKNHADDIAAPILSVLIYSEILKCFDTEYSMKK
tara:strand:- start:214 stop:375 length:162 start_codon:yes stop_codon:yes gene_type:complete